MPPQDKSGELTWSLKRKAVNEAVWSGLVKTYASWSWEEIKRIKKRILQPRRKIKKRQDT